MRILMGVVVLTVLASCDAQKKTEAKTVGAKVDTKESSGVARAPEPPPTPPTTVGSPAARKDFIAAAAKRPELPFRLSSGRTDTELVVDLTDPNDECTAELLSKFLELFDTQIRGAGFKRALCTEQPIALGRAAVGSRAKRQAFLDEAAKTEGLGFALSFGEADTDLMVEIEGDMPCSKRVLTTLAEPWSKELRARGYKRFGCKGPLVAIDVSAAPKAQ